MSKPKVDKNFFSSWSPSMAYILGFIFADGCLVEHKNGYNGLDITSKDLKLLRLIKKELNSEHKIGKKERGYHLQIRNQNIYKDLIELGLTPRKSKTIKFPKVSKKYSYHFIRGLFYGDGSVMVWKEPRWKHTWQIRISFTSGCLQFLEGLREYLEHSARLQGGKICSIDRGYILRYLSMGECINFYNFLYRGNSNLYLIRKKDKFESFLSSKTKEAKTRLRS